MPTLTILPSGTTVDASEGDTILFALLVAGVPIPTECTGKAQCSSCHILVHEGARQPLQDGRPRERSFQGYDGVGPKSRLACQAVVGTGDVTIEVWARVQYHREENADV